MADTIIVSTSDANMVDYPLAIQAAGGDAAIQYGAQEHFRQFLDSLCITGGGRLKFGEFRLTQRAAGANFSVDLSAGYYVIPGSTSPLAVQGKYLVHTTATVNIATPAAPASGTRVHRIVAQVLDKAVDGGSSYGWRIWLMEDTGSGTPAVPANARNIGTVSITAGQANVLNSHIVDGQEYAVIQHGGLGMIYTKEYTPGGANLFTGSPTGAVSFVGMSMEAYCIAGRRYTARWKTHFIGDTASVRMFWSLCAGANATDVSAGSVLSVDEWVYPAVSDAPGKLFEADFTPSSSGTYFFNLGLRVSAGNFTVGRGNANEKVYITLEDRGSDTDDRIVRVTGA